MGGFLSSENDRSDSASAPPKSFYLVLGGPTIRYNRAGRGPLIFDVEPMSTSGADLVEHAEVVRPTCHVNAKQKFVLMPAVPRSRLAGGAESKHYKLQFAVDYSCQAPTSLQVFIDVKIEYRTGSGIVLSARRSPIGGTPHRVLHQTTFRRTATESRAESSTAPATSVVVSSTLADECEPFPLDDLVPAAPRDETSAPCSLKECPIVIVAEFVASIAQPKRPNLISGSLLASQPSPSEMESVASDVTAVHRSYTFLTFDKEKLAATAKAHKAKHDAPLGGVRRGAQPVAESADEEMGEVQHPTATVVKQYLEFSGEVYELDDIYDLGGDDIAPPTTTNAAGDEATPTTQSPRGADDVVDADDDEANTCVICLTNPKDTTVIPCRHLCLCSECAVQLRQQSTTNKCPICRRPIERLMTM